MSYEQITTETAGGVLTITLNRPDRLNAWTPTMGRELIAAFDAAEGITSFLEKRSAHYPDRVSGGLPDIMPWWAEPAFE